MSNQFTVADGLKESVEESTEGNGSQRGERGLAQEDDDEDDEMWAELETVRDEAEEHPPTSMWCAHSRSY